MPDTPELLISIALARLTLLTQLVRVLLRERAFLNNQTPEDILKFSEDMKQFFEKQRPAHQADPFVEAAIDEFFNLLASEVKQDRENQ
jgi:hypothetical protein